MTSDTIFSSSAQAACSYMYALNERRSQSASAAYTCSPATRTCRRLKNISSLFICAFIVSVAMFPFGAAGFVPSTSFRRVASQSRQQQQQQQFDAHFSQQQTENRRISFVQIPSRAKERSSISGRRFMSSVAVAGEQPSGRITDFQKRMRNIVVNDRVRSAESRVGGKNGRPSNVKVVHTLDDYKMAVGNEKDKVVVVRFYATWCKACRAMAPYFYKLASAYKDVQFVEVPVTDKNANLHQGLGVPSLPYGHIYHPDSGLVEEIKINRKYFAKFAKVVHSYAQTSCNLVDGETANPYPDPEAGAAKSKVRA